MLRLGPLELGTVPRIVVPFDDAPSREEIGRLRSAGLDVAELRVDLLAKRELAPVLARLADFAGLPTLATIRLQAEGGGWEGSEAERLTLFQALIPRVDAVDVELAAPIRDEVAGAARSAGCLVLMSHHDFTRTPEPAALADVVARGKQAGADVVKIATAVHGPADVRALARVLADHAESGLVVIGMGEAALATRLLFAALGSLLSYAHAGRATAPGQIPFAEMRDWMRRLYPG